MKITIYELLGLVKDGKAPKKIKLRNEIYEYQHRRDTENCFNYMCNENGEYLSRRYFIDNILNDDVEVIEEDKKIEKLDVDKIYERKYLCDDISIDFLKADIMGISNKINEIIDYIMEDK